MVDNDSNVLDLGCGTGIFLDLIKNKCKSVEGMEISTKVAQIGRQRGYKITLGDVHQVFPYKDNSFNIITAGEIIEHIYDTDFFLNEIKRILKPNGFLIISTPNIATIGRRLMLLFGFNPLIETSLEHASGHIRYFTKKSLEELLNKHGYKITEHTSDTINFTNNGKFQIPFLAKIFPSLGARIIIKTINLK
jgi:2-polyprenyl-3-methyl-5-hydroxy-6-metoxy-1,4-benzoquinol methylase